MTQITTQRTDPLSGIATISTKLKDGLGALHLRLQVEDVEIRFMFSAEDFSRLISGKMIRGYDRDDFNEESNPIVAKRLGEYAIFEVYGVHSYYCRFEELRSLWSFAKPSVMIHGNTRFTRVDMIIKIGCRAMDRVFPADIFRCRKAVAGAT